MHITVVHILVAVVGFCHWQRSNPGGDVSGVWGMWEGIKSRHSLWRFMTFNARAAELRLLWPVKTVSSGIVLAATRAPMLRWLTPWFFEALVEWENCYATWQKWTIFRIEFRCSSISEYEKNEWRFADITFKKSRQLIL